MPDQGREEREGAIRKERDCVRSSRKLEIDDGEGRGRGRSRNGSDGGWNRSGDKLVGSKEGREKGKEARVLGSFYLLV